MLRSVPSDRPEASVLLADADEASREELSRQLEEAGYVVDQVGQAPRRSNTRANDAAPRNPRGSAERRRLRLRGVPSDP